MLQLKEGRDLYCFAVSWGVEERLNEREFVRLEWRNAMLGENAIYDSLRCLYRTILYYTLNPSLPPSVPTYE